MSPLFPDNPTRHDRILILGAGGHGRVVLDILLQAARYRVIGYLDNNRAMVGRRVDGLPVYGPVDELQQFAHELDIQGVIIAIGDNGTRRGLARQVDAAGIPLVNAVHPAATLASTVTVGRNDVICAGAVVCDRCQIGDSVILNTGCVVDYQTMIGEGTHVCPGVRIGGRVKVEPGAFIGIGATVVPKVTIGCESVTGAGAVVIADVPAMATVVGVPARPVRLTSASEDAAAMLLPAQP
jgi:sugar O-acyltransferase (sialic acid O-acetyltransferase NeuD family)